MRLPKTLAGAIDTGEKLLRGNAAVERLWWVEADIAIATRLAVVAEIAQQHLPATLAGFGKTQQRVELAVLHPLARLGRTRLVDEAAAQRDILRAIDHERLGRQAVTAGAAGLLVIGFDACGQVHMQDEAHIGLVDAHPEGDGRRHDQALLMLEAALVLLPRRH